jgi:hypothetical protein
MRLKALATPSKSPEETQGGYFHSERELAVKTKIIFDNLTQGKWRNPIPRFAGNLAQINQLFCERFGEWE